MAAIEESICHSAEDYQLAHEINTSKGLNNCWVPSFCDLLHRRSDASTIASWSTARYPFNKQCVGSICPSAEFLFTTLEELVSQTEQHDRCPPSLPLSLLTTLCLLLKSVEKIGLSSTVELHKGINLCG